MIMNDLRFNKGLPVRILTDAHKSSTSEAVATLLKERGASMEFVLSGATQYTQFMDIRGGAAQALKNGGNNSITAVLTRFYDKSQTCKYKRHYSANGNILPMRLEDVIAMVEAALKSEVSKTIIQRAWDAVAIDLLPDLGLLKFLTKNLKRAFLHTPAAQNKEEIAKVWLEREKDRKLIRDARKIEWICPICGEVLPNSTWKITNGQHKGLTLKEKHISICMDLVGNNNNDSEEKVSSTEERILRGEEEAERAKLRIVKHCPYTGCRKIYKGASLVRFRSHVKECSYRNQGELGSWVIKNSRKYDYDMLDD